MSELYEKRGYLLEEFRLFHLRDGGGTNVDYHYHDFHKLVFLISGSGSYTVEGRRYLLQPGDVVLVGRGCVHKPEIGSGSAYERVILYISGDFLREHTEEDWSPELLFGSPENHVMRLSAESQTRYQTMLSALERELRSGETGSTVFSRCLLLEILVTLYREMHRRGPSPTLPAEPGDEKVLSIIRYLNDHITEDLSIDSLSELFFISKYHMMRRFREEAGMTIHSYLSDKRLFLARDLMANGLSATEACYQCGFKSYSSFSRAYRKRFDATPTGRINIYAAEINE